MVIMEFDFTTCGEIEGVGVSSPMVGVDIMVV